MKVLTLDGGSVTKENPVEYYYWHGVLPNAAGQDPYPIWSTNPDPNILGIDGSMLKGNSEMRIPGRAAPEPVTVEVHCAFDVDTKKEVKITLKPGPLIPGELVTTIAFKCFKCGAA